MGSLVHALSRVLGLGSRQVQLSPRNVVLITGCDSGLGFSLSVFCHSLNMTVVSACHSINSEGAALLRNVDAAQPIHTIELDLLKHETIKDAQSYISKLLMDHQEYEFTALVNNAGVMCFGEFEWQTTQQIEMQINVNLLGTLSLTKEMLPLIRQHRGRIINITSHCGLQALPSLSPYAATKAALRFWNDALRVEMRQYDVDVINFIPGSFVLSSNISARQQEHAKEMERGFSEEQQHFYGAYFAKFNAYLALISGFKPPNQLHDEQLMAKFKHALASTRPKAMYVHEPWRYKFYFLLFRICPTPVADWLKVKFCAMPTYQQVESPNGNID